MYGVYLKYWTLNLMPLMVYPKVLFLLNFSIEEGVSHLGEHDTDGLQVEPLALLEDGVQLLHVLSADVDQLAALLRAQAERLGHVDPGLRIRRFRVRVRV